MNDWPSGRWQRRVATRIELGQPNGRWQRRVATRIGLDQLSASFSLKAVPFGQIGNAKRCAMLWMSNNGGSEKASTLRWNLL